MAVVGGAVVSGGIAVSISSPTLLCVFLYLIFYMPFMLEGVIGFWASFTGCGKRRRKFEIQFLAVPFSGLDHL